MTVPAVVIVSPKGICEFQDVQDLVRALLDSYHGGSRSALGSSPTCVDPEAVEYAMEAYEAVYEEISPARPDLPPPNMLHDMIVGNEISPFPGPQAMPSGTQVIVGARAAGWPDAAVLKSAWDARPATLEFAPERGTRAPQEEGRALTDSGPAEDIAHVDLAGSTGAAGAAPSTLKVGVDRGGSEDPFTLERLDPVLQQEQSADPALGGTRAAGPPESGPPAALSLDAGNSERMPSLEPTVVAASATSPPTAPGAKQQEAPSQQEFEPSGPLERSEPLAEPAFPQVSPDEDPAPEEPARAAAPDDPGRDGDRIPRAETNPSEPPGNDDQATFSSGNEAPTGTEDICSSAANTAFAEGGDGHRDVHSAEFVTSQEATAGGKAESCYGISDVFYAPTSELLDKDIVYQPSSSDPSDTWPDRDWLPILDAESHDDSVEVFLQQFNTVEQNQPYLTFATEQASDHSPPTIAVEDNLSKPTMEQPTATSGEDVDGSAPSPPTGWHLFDL